MSVVMSQSCDLALGRGDTHVLLCPVDSVEALVEAAQKWDVIGDIWAKARDGRAVNVHPLARCSIAGWEASVSLVDFKRVLEVQIAPLRAYCGTLPKRLRLRSPYREQLAQQFARKIMRIGLPVDVPQWKDVPRPKTEAK